MALHKPLVFDTSRGLPRALDQADALHLPGDFQLDGKVGFYGAAPASRPAVAGSWAQTLDDLVKALVALGLITDSRVAGWNTGINSLSSASGVGPYEPGRLIIGSTTGWMQLDQPAAVPGVIQVPTAHAGVQEINPANGLPVQQLAYSPLLSYGATAPPTTPQAGALWFDTANGELKVYGSSGWQPVQSAQLKQLSTAVSTAARGGLLMADGSGGIQALAAGAGSGGRVLMLDSTQQGHYLNLVTVAASSPWPNGVSAFGLSPNGGRPAGVDQAIWCNPAVNAETIGFWDEAAHLWKTVYVNNPVLNQLAELRGALADGDLFTIKGNAVVRLPIGASGESLTVDAGEIKWRDRFTAGPVAPSAALNGDLWLDNSTDVVHVREGGRWLDFNQIERYSDLNGTGGAVNPGTVLTGGVPNWQLAGPTTTAGSVVAIALDAAAGGVRLAAAVGGVVSLTAAQWAAVIDSAEPHAAGTGLSPGRDYYVSSQAAGQLTTKPAGGRGVPVGTALSGTKLLLRNGPMAGAVVNGLAHVGSAPPAGNPGELWWSDTTSQLSVFTDDGTTKQWKPVVVAPTGGTVTPPVTTPAAVGVSDLEAIDWITDPLAAAIQIRYSDGTTGSLRIRGAGGAVVTMADNHTLVIDAGGSLHPPSGGGGAGITTIDAGNFSAVGP